MKKLLIAALLASATFSGTSLAQTATSPTAGDPAMPAAGTDAAPGNPVTQGGMGTEAQSSGMMQSQNGFYTYQKENQMLGSGLMGAQVRGAGGENIGEVDDLLLDRNGQVMAIVVGVGGFLGIGEKDVAIANDRLQFVMTGDAGSAASATGTAAAPATAPGATAPAAGTAGTAMAPGTATGTAAPSAGTTATGTAMAPGTTTGTATTGVGTTNPAGTAMVPGNGMAGSGMGTTGTGMGGMGYGWNWTGAGIDHIQVEFTRDQLQGAPAFEEAG